MGVFNLPYFPKEYRFHFNAHNLIVYGQENGQYLVSDPIMETVTTISREDLNRVRFAKGFLAPKGHIYFPKGDIAVNEDLLKRGIIKGIRRNVRDMIKAPGYVIGVSGIKYTAGRVRKWRNKLGERKAGLYLGQIVRMQEEIGTGGGGFRYIYAAFLQEAAGILDRPELSKVSEQFAKAGGMWRDTAMEMAGVYKGKGHFSTAFQ